MIYENFDPATLSDREREVVRCIGEGMSYMQAGRALLLASGTVRTYAQRVAVKAAPSKYRTRDVCHRVFSILESSAQT
jgi:DNA-binding NarL/FixJ family response regulator